MKSNTLFELRDLVLSEKTPDYLKIENIFKIMNLNGSEPVETLFEVIEKEESDLVSHEAIFALGEMISEKTVPFLKKILTNNNSSIIKHESLITIGTIGDEADIDFLKRFLDSKEFEISCSARIAIDRIKQKENFEEEVKKNKEKYIKLLFDERTTQNDRTQILFQLMRIGDIESINAIYKVLINDPCRVVRHEAAFCLGEFKTDIAGDLLVKAINKEKTDIVIHESLFALGTIGEEKYVDFIKKYLNHPKKVVSESAKIAIDRIKKLKNPYSGLDYFKNLK